MKKNVYKIILFIALGFFAAGCENDVTESLYEVHQGGNLPQPVVNSITPDGYALAGVDAVELTGSNFSAVGDNNLVYFGSVKAKVLEASATRLLVRAPNNPADTLTVKVAVMGAEKYSESRLYKLLAAAQDYAVKTGRKAYAITVDKNENIYASATESDAGIGIIKILPDGVTVENFAPKGGETFFNVLKLGPTGFVYGARGQRALFEIQPGVASKSFVTMSAGQIIDFDFDKDGYMWLGGKDLKDSVYRVTMTDKAKKSFPFKGEVRAVRVFNGYLYIAALRDGAEKIFRLPLSAGTLGAEEEYFNMTAAYPEKNTVSMLISASGKIYIGTSSKSPETDYGTENSWPILVVNTDKSSSIMFDAMIPDSKFAGPVVSMAWGAGEYFYFTRAKLDKTDSGGTKTTVQNHEIVKIAARELSAPYYGRGDQ